jgi:hypothetical protein
MAAKRWLGVAPAIRQVSTITIGGGVTIGDTYTVNCGFGTITVTAAVATTASVAVLLQAALSSSSASPEFSDMTWTVDSSVVTGTSATPGVPVTLTVSKVGTGTITLATPTAASGPNFFNVALNWNGGTVPAITDTITVEANSPAILYGLTTITALMAKTTIEAGFNQAIGLPEINPRGYREYRDQFLAINTTALEVGTGTGFRSSLIKLDLGTVGTSVIVFGTGGASDPNELPLQLRGGSAATLVATSGTIGIATRASDTGGFTSITVADSANVECGLGCTHTTVTSNGFTRLENTATNLNVRNGTTITTGQATNIDVSGGNLAYQSAATITSAYVGPGSLDCSDLRGRTCTTLRMRSGGQLIDPQKTLTITTLLLETGVKGITTQ